MDDPATNSPTIEAAALLKQNKGEPEDVAAGPRPGAAAQRNAKEFLATVLDHLHDSLLVIDPGDYTILEANRSFADSCGLTREAVIGRHCYDLTHDLSAPCSTSDHRCPLAETLKTGDPATAEHIHHNGDGGKRYVEITTIPIIGQTGWIEQIIHLSRDITDRRRVEESLQKSNLKLHALIDNLPFLAWMKDSEGRFMAVNEPFARSCGRAAAGDLIGKTDLDVWPERLAEAYRNDDLEVMRSRQKKAVEELIADQGAEKWFETFKAPLIGVDGHPIGTVGIARDITERKQSEDQLQQTLESLRKAFGATVQVMVSAVETRDPYTAGHQLRVADLARAIATEMGLPQQKIDAIRMAASIHDIGKLSIPAEILSKPTKLSEIEFSLIREHARQGYGILKDVESPWPLADIVRQHHERIDGSGYPDRLKGEEILIEARIIAVADVVEAMASHRPYRPGMGIQKALDEIDKNSGIYYDSAVAGTCLRLFREKGFVLERT